MRGEGPYRRRVLRLLAFGLVPGVVGLPIGTARAAEEIAMKSAKRKVPKPPPVVARGVRYEVEFGGKTRGFPHTGGVVAAVDDATGRELWTAVVYRVTFNPHKEEDTQEVFITDLALDGDETHLLVTNEAGERFAVDLETHAVTPVP
jgi:hypothetical protein